MADNLIKADIFYVSKLLPKRQENSNKDTFGTVLNFSGSIYYSGAAYFSSISALKAGAGLVKLASESSVINRVASMSYDITFIDLGQNDYGTIPKDSVKYIKNLKTPSSVIVGCGISTLQPAREFILKLLSFYKDTDVPIIIDADAINIISAEKNPPIPVNSVMTPHVKELSRLIKKEVSEIEKDKVYWAKYASEQYDCIIVLKGKDTVISIPNGPVIITSTGNSSLSHAGTGDILSGMIAGFAAQKVKLEDACTLATYIHGRAGELASRKLTEYSTLASDVIEFIPDAIKELMI